MHDNFTVGFGTGLIICGLIALICCFVLTSSGFTAILLAVGFMESWIGISIIVLGGEKRDKNNHTKK